MWRMLICVLVICVTPAFGQESTDSAVTKLMNTCVEGLTPTSFTLTSVYRSQYVLGNGVVVADRLVVQTDLFLTTKCGLTLDLWTSAPADLSDLGRDYATELDLYLGWSGKVEGFNLSFGADYADMYRTLSVESSDLLILSAEISRDFKLAPSLSVSPFLRVETNFTFDGVVCGDTLPRLGTRFAWDVTDSLSLSGKAMLVYDPGIYGGDSALVGSIESSLSWKLGDNATLEFPYVRYVSPITSVSDGRRGEFVYGLGISFKF